MRLSAAALTAALTVPLLLAASGCSKESDRARDRTSAAQSPSGTASSAAPSTGTPSSEATYPSYAESDYRYHLEVLCYCPQVGTVEVVVRDGKVTEATSLDGPAAGAPAPDFTRLSINDIIAQANDPDVAEAKVKWPAGQEHPSSVMLDRIAQAVDDEVTYTIKHVRATAGE